MKLLYNIIVTYRSWYRPISPIFRRAISLNQKMSQNAAIFGLQCFWGSEVRYATINGVISTSVGYTGGSTLNPTYKQLADHTEVVRVTFDPNLIGFEKLLDIFWSSHEPTYQFKQQYKSAIFYANEEQKQLAEKSLNERQKQLSKPIVTQILPLDVYYLAEDYHQKYFLRKHKSIVAELKLSDKQIIESPVVSRLNGFLAGFGSIEQLEKDLKTFGISLSDKNQSILREAIKGGPNLGEC